MILPTKYISNRYSLIGVGAVIIERLDKPKTVTSVWEAIKQNPEIGTFERFILGLDFLHIIGAIEIKEGLLQRCQH
jgi:hypothetical protein